MMYLFIVASVYNVKQRLTIAIAATCAVKHDTAITFKTGSLADSVLQIPGACVQVTLQVTCV